MVKKAKLKTAEDYFNRGEECLSSSMSRAIKHFTKCIILEPNYTKAFLKRGIAYFETGEFSEALSDFKKILELDPDFHIAHQWVCKCFIKLGSLNDALQHLDHYLKINPLDPYINYYTGIIHIAKENYQLAINSFKTAIKAKPDFAMAHYQQTNVLCLMENYKNALIVIDKAISLLPTASKLLELREIMAYILRAEAYRSQKNYFLAKQEILNALKIDITNQAAQKILRSIVGNRFFREELNALKPKKWLPYNEWRKERDQMLQNLYGPPAGKVWVEKRYTKQHVK